LKKRSQRNRKAANARSRKRLLQAMGTKLPKQKQRTAVHLKRKSEEDAAGRAKNQAENPIKGNYGFD
jgi:hypothetical protein